MVCYKVILNTVTFWDNDTIKLVQRLNEKLKIDHLKWHKDKGINIKDPQNLFQQVYATNYFCNEKETLDYIEESIKWLKEINVDKPCPSKIYLLRPISHCLTTPSYVIKTFIYDVEFCHLYYLIFGN